MWIQKQSVVLNSVINAPTNGQFVELNTQFNSPNLFQTKANTSVRNSNTETSLQTSLHMCYFHLPCQSFCAQRNEYGIKACTRITQKRYCAKLKQTKQDAQHGFIQKFIYF